MPELKRVEIPQWGVVAMGKMAAKLRVDRSTAATLGEFIATEVNPRSFARP